MEQEIDMHHDARTEGQHVGREGHKLPALEKRLTASQQVTRADRMTHRAEISREHAITRGTINMLRQAFGNAYIRGQRAVVALAIGELLLAGGLAKLAGWF